MKTIVKWKAKRTKDTYMYIHFLGIKFLYFCTPSSWSGATALDGEYVSRIFWPHLKSVYLVFFLIWCDTTLKLFMLSLVQTLFDLRWLDWMF